MDEIKQKLKKVIYRLQEYFKTDLLYLIKGEFYLMSGKIVGLLSSFLLALVWANWIDPTVYGNYQFIISVLAIVSVFSLPELSTAVVQAVARQMEGSFLRSFKVRLKWGILTSLAALTVGGYYLCQKNYVFALCFLIGALFLPLFEAALIYSNFLAGRKYFDVKVKYDALTQVAAAAAMITLLFFARNFQPAVILVSVIGLYFFSRTFLRFFFFLRTKKKFNPNKQEDPKTITYGKHLTFTGFICTISSHLDQILLFHYLGPINVAVYSFALAIPKQFKSILEHVASLALPKLSVRSREELKRTFLRKLLYLTGGISLAVFAYVIIAPWVYQLFFPQYMASVPYSRLYALSAIPLCFAFIGGILRSQMMIKEIYQIRIISSVIKIVLSFILIPLFGIWGAILSVLIDRFSTAVIYLFMYYNL